MESKIENDAETRIMAQFYLVGEQRSGLGGRACEFSTGEARGVIMRVGSSVKFM